MENCTLSLLPYDKEPLDLVLYEDIPSFDAENIEKLIKNKVYSDLTYEFRLSLPMDIDEVKVYVNGYEFENEYNNGVIKFHSNPRLFSDYFGFVQIAIDVILFEGKRSFYTEFLNVMVKNIEVTKSIKLMSEYVYNNQDKLLLDNNMRSLDNFSLRQNAPKSFEAYLRIMHEVINTYRNLYKTFLTSSKYVLKNSRMVDKFEKLSYVDSQNINYIIQHPDQFREISRGKGISVNRKNYIPNKTLVNDNDISYNIYENQIVLGFIHTVIKSIDDLSNRINAKLSVLNSFDDTEDGYEISAGYIYSVTKKKFEDFSKQTLELKSKLFVIYNNYKNIFSIKGIEIRKLPKPTPIFMNVKHYNSIYKCIKKWYKYGIYDMQRENFLLPLLANSQLYEYYLLLKLYNYLDESGLSLSDKEKFKYNQGYDKLKETTHCNTFVFEGNGKKVTLYYQPVVNKEGAIRNGIALIRNTCIPYVSLSNSEYYYLPDFILKIESNNNSIYVILDAKFSLINNVKRRYYKDLAFKYLFSFSPINMSDQIVGLCAINGKYYNKYEGIESVYNDNVPKTYLPYADIMTLVENDSDDTAQNQKNLFDYFFGKYYKLIDKENNQS